MTTLSDIDILDAIYHGHNIAIDPFNDDQLQPCSYDVRLGDTFKALKNITAINPHRPPTSSEYLTHEGVLLLRRGDFALATTHETVSLDSQHMALLHGKSSLARLGLIIHTAGLIDPGFYGQITLELSNLGSAPILLKPYMLIGQLEFRRLANECEHDYDKRGRYQGQSGATISKGV